MIDFILLLGFGFINGVQHGIDLDHIAAITDITSVKSDRRRSIWYATLYGLGHGIVVIFLGLIFIVIGQSLPASVDIFFSKLVGITLILLGLYVFYSLYRHGEDFKIKSRWMIVFEIITLVYHKLLHNLHFFHVHEKNQQQTYAPKSAFVVGMIHGVGAETPTQITVLAAVLGIGGGIRSMLFLIIFVAGILISNIALAAVSSFGILKVKRWKVLYISVGMITALFSLAVGMMFLLT